MQAPPQTGNWVNSASKGAVGSGGPGAGTPSTQRRWPVGGGGGREGILPVGWTPWSPHLCQPRCPLPNTSAASPCMRASSGPREKLEVLGSPAPWGAGVGTGLGAAGGSVPAPSPRGGLPLSRLSVLLQRAEPSPAGPHTPPSLPPGPPHSPWPSHLPIPLAPASGRRKGSRAGRRLSAQDKDTFQVRARLTSREVLARGISPTQAH